MIARLRSLVTPPPGPSEAVHAIYADEPGLTAMCGVDLTGEPQMPDGARITCPRCARLAR